MKGYYRQKKKTSITKSKSKSLSTSKKKSAKSAAKFLDLQDEFDAKEKLLREFDMNMAYGPCIGMSRLQRWQRAEAFGLKPPKEIENLLKSGEARHECLWSTRFNFVRPTTEYIVDGKLYKIP
ncbi:hypothetical protein ACH5RR_032782 [Cinchona calisaya]|uniref:DNA polymerase delta subunit 4 n=1 Tax=Cinchona calisaya TaxID=153742 RepID=A0ABD2YN87_9GENT